MQDFEKLGIFYLGRRYDAAAKKPMDDLLLYQSKDLVTHAVVVGMTGSGKTGLCIAMLEEAAIDGIPAIVIDPKGDMGNLLLQFPDLAPSDFAPWVNAEEAQSQGLSVDDFAAKQAELWRNGLAKWGEDGGANLPPQGVSRFRNLYTGQQRRTPVVDPEVVRPAVRGDP